MTQDRGTAPSRVPWPSPCPRRFAWSRCDRLYPGLARNAGVAVAQCAWIAFTDAGVVLDEDWLAELALQAGPGVDVVYGGLGARCATASSASAPRSPTSRPEDRSGTRGPSVASCLMRREAFSRAGGFPPFRAAEDLIFIARLAAQGSPRELRAKGARRVADRRRHGVDVQAIRRVLVSQPDRRLGQALARGNCPALCRALAGDCRRAAARRCVGWAFLLLPGFFLARAFKAAWLKRASFDFPTLTPARILGTAGVLAVIDAATALGVARWLVARARH